MYFYCIIKPNKCGIYEDVVDGLAEGKSLALSHLKLLKYRRGNITIEADTAI